MTLNSNRHNKHTHQTTAVTHIARGACTAAVRVRCAVPCCVQRPPMQIPNTQTHREMPARRVKRTADTPATACAVLCCVQQQHSSGVQHTNTQTHKQHAPTHKHACLHSLTEKCCRSAVSCAVPCRAQRRCTTRKGSGQTATATSTDSCVTTHTHTNSCQRANRG